MKRNKWDLANASDFAHATPRAVACITSAESEGRGYVRISKIDKVTIADAVASDWIVRGTLGLRDDYRAPVTDHRDFTCRVGEGGVEQVTVGGTDVTAR
ncbi:MAG: hypothetical protein ABIS51_18070 [Sphingomonas sp.]